MANGFVNSVMLDMVEEDLNNFLQETLLIRYEKGLWLTVDKIRDPAAGYAVSFEWKTIFMMNMRKIYFHVKCNTSLYLFRLGLKLEKDWLENIPYLCGA